ncbi:MAG: LysR family transcriptional regulator [Collinsella sp.]
MTLQQLRFLIAVAESGSINAAAQRLYTAQSTSQTPSKAWNRSSTWRSLRAPAAASPSPTTAPSFWAMRTRS